MKTYEVSYVDIKQRVSIRDLISRYNIQLRNNRGDCPLPSHANAKDKNTFSITTDKGAGGFSCFSDSCVANRRHTKGRKGGGILELVAEMEKTATIKDAALKLADWYGIPVNRPNGSASPAKEPEARKKPLTFTLKVEYCDYLKERGVSPKLAQFFGIGHCISNSKQLKGKLAIPLHDAQGNLMSYCGRTLDGTEPKYMFYAGFEKGKMLYNLHRLTDSKWNDTLANSVVIVEGFFQCLRVWEAGFPVVALMGSVLTGEQERLLAAFSRVILLLDGDEPGRAAADKIAARLVHHCLTRVVDLPDGQPDQISIGEIQQLLS